MAANLLLSLPPLVSQTIQYGLENEPGCQLSEDICGDASLAVLVLFVAVAIVSLTYADCCICALTFNAGK
eukprot:1107521-Ditylum_brightwellii.AAC.1